MKQCEKRNEACVAAILSDILQHLTAAAPAADIGTAGSVPRAGTAAAAGRGGERASSGGGIGGTAAVPSPGSFATPCRTSHAVSTPPGPTAGGAAAASGGGGGGGAAARAARGSIGGGGGGGDVMPLGTACKLYVSAIDGSYGEPLNTCAVCGRKLRVYKPQGDDCFVRCQNYRLNSTPRCKGTQISKQAVMAFQSSTAAACRGAWGNAGGKQALDARHNRDRRSQ